MTDRPRRVVDEIPFTAYRPLLNTGVHSTPGQVGKRNEDFGIAPR
jgi:hypothetical protein